MTGNLVFIAVGLSSHDAVLALHASIALAAFGAGAWGAARLMPREDPSVMWPARVTTGVIGCALVQLGFWSLWLAFGGSTGASFVGVLAALLTLDRSRLRPGVRVPHRSRQLRDGLAYARYVPEILAPLCMMALIGTFTYEFEVSLPLFARGPLSGAAATYSWLMGAFGLGAVLGGIYCTRRPQTGVPRMIRAAAMYMVAMLATATPAA